jgi:hypothetical protein
MGTDRANFEAQAARVENVRKVRRLSIMIAGLNNSACQLSLFFAISVCSSASANETRPSVEFNRDIRLILSDNCFHCHGPDQAQRKANLRLDTEEGAIAVLESGGHAIVRGNLSESALAQRITSSDDDERMPPPDSGRKLTSAQKDLLLRWIEEGAKWQNHWSLIPPTRPPLPPTSDRNWSRTPWDTFVLARLKQEGLKPSPEADRETLLRRVTLDLTGLPPALPEIDAYLHDKSRNAYEKVVDRLLASSRYGERMATDWLDAARYADTNGYQTDGTRFMWRWRDWVIDALNHNMPFDQFTIEQLAGDMLDDATLEQKIATGFNRNHRGNAEGGIIPQEYAAEYVVDRVDTTATVWLGLTLGCARCHDHKFDPFSQKEFYQLFAMFNNVPERGRAVRNGNSDPQIKAPTSAQQAELRDIDKQLTVARAHFDQLQPQIARSQHKWEKTLRREVAEDWWPHDGLLLHLPLDENATDRRAHPLANAANQELTFASGPINKAAEFSGKQAVNIGDVCNFGYFDRLSIGFWIKPQRPDGVVLGRMAEAVEAEGYNIELSGGKLQLNLIKRWLDESIRVETVAALNANHWQHVLVTYDGSRLATGVKIYVNGLPVTFRVLVDELNSTFAAKQPFVLGAGGPGPRFVGKLDDLRIYGRALPAEEAGLLATLSPIDAIAAIPTAERTSAQAKKINACFLDQHAPENVDDVRLKIAHLEQERSKLVDSITTTMVMQEMPEPRASFVLLRGQYDQPGERVSPSVPASLCWPDQPPIRNRLEFARWLVNPQNPLTARVTVNRVWQLHFGQGLVKTVNDFGSQGERPSHPELLDYLATAFMTSGWDIKALHKSIVMSATYRQSSRLTPMLAARDPDNRLLARGPRLRMSAEMVRDQALSVSGLLVEKLGGPSVLPYQPAGLWKELSDVDFTQDHGDSLYRRSLYTFWKRTVAPPSMVTFDAASRESCRVLQTRTNTPLQALTLMNEVTFVEAARKLAERALEAGGTRTNARLKFIFRLVLGRQPTSAELQILNAGLAHHLEHYRRNPQAAAELLAVGESPRDEKLDIIELAAYAATSNLILNLDETITVQ